ncbi:MAG: glucose-6-phosphate isomerase [Bacteroidetes bacterium]|jgi:glucose-6-phosphate isomerase|nr:glucose-6-phosphate isomerase [Bacteroidota bacterium]MBT6684772.1 glucose-6-phosphate isomerase [Bacteroidota bacterium]MBT7141806.1 glucose-6-phosphate isomerase [Bacteroidota bacterium]MBT7490755.1 glucose-6-phosphate isomerase [Bacteroidota bacterium]
MKIELNINKISDFVTNNEISEYSKKVEKSNNLLSNKTGAGSDFLGWHNLPSAITEKEITEIEETVALFKNKIEVLVVIGIGGSYLGAKSIIEALKPDFQISNKKPHSPKIVFAGHNISEDYLFELLEFLNKKSYAIAVISKSGTTTEPAIAFRFLKQHIEKKYGKTDAGKRIVAITDKSKGALRKLAEEESYKTFIIPDDVGGRYSVLTPVGLIPIAFAGFDIRQFIEGAKFMEQLCHKDTKFEKNPAAVYAAARNALYEKGKIIEILVNYNSKLQFIAEWWKQLFGESEGKEGKGIFPASVNFTSDLHSMGQYIQDGKRNLFETVISVKQNIHKLIIPEDAANLDSLNYISGKRVDEVNKMAELGTSIAHIDGGVPNIKIELPEINEYYLGQLIYFFEKACALSGYTLGINPFDQPGVEDYKRNMFALLKKPGYEKETAEILNKL